MEYGINHPIAKACSSLGKKIQIFNREIFNDHVSATIDDRNILLEELILFQILKFLKNLKIIR